ncbi:LLM class flavin-dependent oxidoreductase [Chryseobacterium phosphatilyticum]|uniref:LLM class flavin-dependent oxidoreductase n=1 Tax=Chryseobacterium phosphatilyticum TaxID=475075 RepID=A0A316X955_9FLAO|nr:LLM class flavin-dependent oxidoreductase [Chryseobacterium phosphatilyticum]PWN70341.1 LLM class flavin-dependent oxidoreductase [Chryseobacterium phosphatilyticum]
MANKLKIGLLEFGSRNNSLNNPKKTLYDIIEYATTADELGFSRFWVTENYFSKANDVAWSTPEMLLPILLGLTDKIKIGIAGVIMPLQSPFRVAHNYKLLSSLYPKRLDLGFVKGLVGEYDLQRFNMGVDKDNYFSSFIPKLEATLRFLREEDELLKEDVIIPPFKGNIPDIWYMGSSHSGLEVALQHDLNFARSIFHGESNKEYLKEELQNFKKEYKTKHGKDPAMVLTFSGCCHNTKQKALKVAMSSTNNEIGAVSIIGDGSFFHEKLLEFKELYGYNEFIFSNVSKSHKDSLTALEILSQYV